MSTTITVNQGQPVFGSLSNGPEGNGETVAAGVSHLAEFAYSDDDLTALVSIDGSTVTFEEACLVDAFLSVAQDAALTDGALTISTALDGAGSQAGPKVTVPVGATGEDSEHRVVAVPKGSTLTVDIANGDSADAKVYVELKLAGLAV